MRKTKFDFTPPANVAQPAAQTSSFDSSVVRDLSSLIKRPIETPPAPKTEAKTEENAPANQNQSPTETPPAPETKGTANLGEDFNKFKETFTKQATQAIEDPKRAAATSLKLINFIRVIAYPFLQKWGTFERQELADLENVLAKVFELEKSAKTPEQLAEKMKTLNMFETRVYNKWRGLEEHKKGNAWTTEEINFLVDVGNLKMQEIKFLRWIMENEFMMALLFIEGRRIVPVVTARMGMGFIDLPNFL